MTGDDTAWIRKISIPFNLLTAIWSLKSSLIERAEIIPCFATPAVAINVTLTTTASLNLLLEYLCVLMDRGSKVLCGLDKD